MAEKSNNPVFKKPIRVVGNKVVFRNAKVSDAEFILSLRLDPIKGKFLSATSSDIEQQIQWLERYERDDNQVYFIIEDRFGERYGTIRLYDGRGDSFGWGSWILRDERPNGFAVESLMMLFKFALTLGFTSAHFDCRKQNSRVWQFYESLGARRISETEKDYFYSLSKIAIDASINRYQSRLPNGIEIIG